MPLMDFVRALQNPNPCDPPVLAPPSTSAIAGSELAMCVSVDMCVDVRMAMCVCVLA